MLIGFIQIYLVTSHLARTLSSSSALFIYSVLLNLSSIIYLYHISPSN